MKIYRILLSISLFLAPCLVLADDDFPSFKPTASYTDNTGEDNEISILDDIPSISGNAPLKVTFAANPENTVGWNEYFEWRFTQEGKDEPYIIRYDEDTDVTFTKAGTTRVVCYAIFTQGNDSIVYTKEFWDEHSPLSVTISESRLEMPNAFSPNGDGINDYYAPKTQQSLVKFKASIYSRWGQKLYEWTDPAADGWDGKFNGRDVAQGVYFCDVVAEGADGIKYHFRKDVNLLRGYNEDRSTVNE